jgi:phytoene dehydrogenase-like protein
MARYDVVVIGAGLGGLTAGAILARAGRKVLVIERGNSVGGAASSYKVGDLFVEGSLHETSDPRDPHDPKHDPLTRAGVLDAVTWVRSDDFYQVRGGPVGSPLSLPANFDGARAALSARFPAAADGIARFFHDMKQVASSLVSPGHQVIALEPATEWSLSLQQKLDRSFGDNEALKCALAANLAYYHDDPVTVWWPFFASSQASYLRSGACYVQGGSQRLSSALARAIKSAGGEVIVRRSASAIAPRVNGICMVTHNAKDGSDPKTIEAVSIVSNAAPETAATLLPDAAGRQLRQQYAALKSSISLFTITLGLSQPPRTFGVSSYSTQLFPPWLKTLADYAQATTLMASEPGERIPPLAVVDYSAIDAGVPSPPHVLSIFGPDHLSNWDGRDIELYRAKRARWQDAIVRYLDGIYPGIAKAVVASSFNTALSVRQYLNAPDGAVYGFAPNPPAAGYNGPMRSPQTVVPGLYLSSAYANFGGYTGVIQGAAVCADLILRDA